MLVEDIIASYLAQKKECVLPHIGKLSIVKKSPKSDAGAHQMMPPDDEIIFTESADHRYSTLTNYVCNVENIDQPGAEEKINHWCLESKIKLDDNKKILLSSLGELYKSEDGSIIFNKINEVTFYEPVIADFVIHEHAEHTILVGDNETTSEAMHTLYDETPAKKEPGWKIPALILAIISAIMFLYVFMQRSLTSSGVSNQSSIEMQSSHETYRSIR